MNRIKTQKRQNIRCPICLNNIYMGRSHMIHNTLYKKSSQQRAMKRLHQGKPAHTKHKKAILLPCEHLFHQKCIKKWFKRNPSCPLCRN